MDIALELYNAARDNELVKLDDIIRRHTVNFENGRPFSLAILYNDLSAVKLLLKKGADFELKDSLVSLKDFCYYTVKKIIVMPNIYINI